MASTSGTLHQRRSDGATSATTPMPQPSPGESQVKEQTVLSSAPPPSDTILLYISILCIALYTFPSIQQLDIAATITTFQGSALGVSTQSLAIIRAVYALVIWGTSLSCIFGKGWEILPPYHPRSRLKRNVPLRAVGLRTMFPFTSWSWNMLGFYFTASSYIAATGTASPWLLRSTFIAWSIAAPCALLVAAVVKYALWPAAVAKQPPAPHALGSVRNILMHNANVVMVMTEAVLWGIVPIRSSEACLSVLWGCAYIIFAWNTNLSWNAKEHGPQFIYFFFDTTTPGYSCSLSLMVLLMVLLFFFEVFCGATMMMSFVTGSGGAGSSAIGPRIAYVLLMCAGTLRFRD